MVRVLFYSFFLTLFCLQKGLAYFQSGDLIKIGEIEYEIVRPLGEGGIKTAYLAHKKNCTKKRTYIFVAPK